MKENIEESEIDFLSNRSLSYSSSDQGDGSDLQVDRKNILDDDNKNQPSISPSTIIESNTVQIEPCCNPNKCIIS
jgi:hypothetical protein